MIAWYIVDNCFSSKGSQYEHPIAAKTREEAEDIGKIEWHLLPNREREQRDEFSVVLAKQYADGELDWENVFDKIVIKEKEK